MLNNETKSHTSSALFYMDKIASENEFLESTRFQDNNSTFSSAMKDSFEYSLRYSLHLIQKIKNIDEALIYIDMKLSSLHLGNTYLKNKQTLLKISPEACINTKLTCFFENTEKNKRTLLKTSSDAQENNDIIK